ncbi:cytochrome P450 [Xylaria sp. FL1042]|nr:cytochrome P450 [Xylaria sp. FL1042]
MPSLAHSESLTTASSFLASISIWQWLLLAGGILVLRAILVSIYNVFFHPLAKYPGPRLASISDIWMVQASKGCPSSSGKWPWVVERAVKKYDVHGPKRDLKDTFVKTPLMDGLGDEDDGLLWERNPERHRVVSKTMSPAFSGNSLRAKVPTLNKHIDLMISQMREHGQGEAGLDWFTWLAMDSATDLACGWELHELRDMKTHAFLDGMDAASMLAIILATTKIYPILTPAVMLLTPWRLMRTLPQMLGALRTMVRKRIETRDNLKHSDFFEQLLPPGKEAPKTNKDMRHMLTVIGQLIIGGYDTTSVTSYMMLYFGLRNPEVLEELKREVRGTFSRYEDITAENLRSLPWLNACMQETLRVVTVATHHSLPRISPGGTVDGTYVPKGVICRTALFTYNRSERFFHDPSSFKPERWLSPDHPKYDPVFAGDDRRAYMPFIIGPRQCPGREMAKITFRLVLAKLFWSFDIEQVSKRLDFDTDFRVYSAWLKPELRVRFLPVKRES